MTYWVVFLDNQENLWALHTDKIDKVELPEEETLWHEEDVDNSDREFESMDNLFGQGTAIAQLGSVVDLTRSVLYHRPMSPRRLVGVSRWSSSTWESAECWQREAVIRIPNMPLGRGVAFTAPIYGPRFKDHPQSITI